jgi:hypothetical protein
MRNSALVRTLTGRNLTGRTIHAIIDVLPIFNIHEIVKAAIRDNPNANWKEVGVTVINKIDWYRTVLSVGVAYLLVTGKLSPEQIDAILRVFAP